MEWTEEVDNGEESSSLVARCVIERTGEKRSKEGVRSVIVVSGGKDDGGELLVILDPPTAAEAHERLRSSPRDPGRLAARGRRGGLTRGNTAIAVYPRGSGRDQQRPAPWHRRGA